MYQYWIQIGNYPHISFFRISADVYKTREEAENAAMRYLEKYRKFNPNNISKKWIHTRFVHTNVTLATPQLRPKLDNVQTPRDKLAAFDTINSKRVWS